MSYLDDPLRMISIRLPEEAKKTYRVLNDGQPRPLSGCRRL